MTKLDAAPGHDRRLRRSEDPITALHYQLSFTRAEAGLEAVVLVDDRGCLVAGAGAWPVCEELAAFAPLLADASAPKSRLVGSRVADLSSEVELCAIEIDGVPALLCGRGRGAPRGSIARAAAGCRRILAAAAC